MKVRDLISTLISDTELNDTISFFDEDAKEFKDITIQRLGTSVYFRIKNRKKSDMEMREDFFK